MKTPPRFIVQTVPPDPRFIIRELFGVPHIYDQHRCQSHMYGQNVYRQHPAPYHRADYTREDAQATADWLNQHYRGYDT